MNRAYNDNREYTDALDGLRFSDGAKARMVDHLLDAAAQQPPVQQKTRRRASRLPRIAAIGVAAALVLGVGAGATGVLKTAGEAFSGVFGDRLYDVTLRFTGGAMRYVLEKTWHSSQKIRRSSNELMFSVRVSDPQEVLYWAKQWGHEAEVVSVESVEESVEESKS